jgi:hypothetical protein
MECADSLDNRQDVPEDEEGEEVQHFQNGIQFLEPSSTCSLLVSTIDAVSASSGSLIKSAFRFRFFFLLPLGGMSDSLSPCYLASEFQVLTTLLLHFTTLVHSTVRH